MTTTSASRRIFAAGVTLEHLRREADDLHEVAVAQLAGDGAEDARPPRIVLGVDDHRGVLVEGDVRAVLAPELLLRAHDDGLDDLALLDGALRVGLLDGRRDDVADPRVAPARATLDADAQDLARARVVGDLEAGLVLDHCQLTPFATHPRMRDCSLALTSRAPGSRPAASASSATSAGTRRRARGRPRWRRCARRGRAACSNCGRSCGSACGAWRCRSAP